MRMGSKTSMLIGLDKIVLSNQNYQIKDGSVFSNTVTTKPGTPPVYLFTDGKGKDWNGKVFSNQDRYTVDVNNTGLRIVCNPSRIEDRNPNHLCMTRPGLGISYDHIISGLNKLGIDLDLKDSNLSRIDLAKDGQLPGRVSSYVDVMRCLNAPRLKNTVQYPDGYLHSNTLRQICFYNRGKKILIDGGEISPGIDPDKWGRLELRMTKKRSVEATLEIVKLGQLLDMDPEQYQCAYNNYVTGDFFKNKVDPSISLIDLESEKELFREYYLKGKRGSAVSYATDLGMNEILKLHGSFDRLRLFFVESGMNVKTSYRNIEQLRKRFQVNSFIQNRRKIDSAGSRINELQNIFGIAI
jgi:hypothetical protein